MEKNDETTVEEIMSSMKCPKDFACVKNGFQNVLQSKCFAGKFFTCTGSNSYMCPYLLPFGYSHFCTCPLFVHIAKIYSATGKIFAKSKLQHTKRNKLVADGASTVDID
jgi:hypothetical protein